MKTVKFANIKVSKSGKLMVVDGDVNIRTNLTTLPDWAESVTYDPAKVEEYNGGKYANGVIQGGLSDVFKAKSRFLKEMEA